MNCRHCESKLKHTFLNLGFAPPSNAYLTKDDLSKPEKYYPLKIKVCNQCWLVQTEDYAQVDELFSNEYAYFSSTSSTWLDHAKRYSQKIIEMLKLNSESHVVEVASNDGYLLKNFLKVGIPCLGIEPTDSTANTSENLGIPVLRKFFSENLAKKLSYEGKQADLIVGNNVYAHVPDINDFTKGLKALLKPDGTITLEFPHLMQLIRNIQFDTIYHEHFSYLSLYSVSRIFQFCGLRIFDVEELKTHGGSLRIYGCHQEDRRIKTARVGRILMQEKEQGMQEIETYTTFQQLANRVKNNVLEFLIEQDKLGRKVVAYGAAAKGNTLLNYAGVKPDLLSFVSDAAEAKQGKYMPGSHIPILSPEAILEAKPDFVLILPWNIADEVKQKNCKIYEWGGQFVTTVPDLKFI